MGEIAVFSASPGVLLLLMPIAIVNEALLSLIGSVVALLSKLRVLEMLNSAGASVAVVLIRTPPASAGTPGGVVGVAAPVAGGSVGGVSPATGCAAGAALAVAVLPVTVLRSN